MVVSLPKRQQQQHQQHLHLGWELPVGHLHILLAKLLCFCFVPCLLLGTVFGHLAGAVNSARGSAGNGVSQPFGSLHKIKIKAKVRLLPATRR